MSHLFSLIEILCLSVLNSLSCLKLFEGSVASHSSSILLF